MWPPLHTPLLAYRPLGGTVAPHEATGTNCPFTHYRDSMLQRNALLLSLINVVPPTRVLSPTTLRTHTEVEPRKVCVFLTDESPRPWSRDTSGHDGVSSGLQFRPRGVVVHLSESSVARGYRLGSATSLLSFELLAEVLKCDACLEVVLKPSFLCRHVIV